MTQSLLEVLSQVFNKDGIKLVGCERDVNSSGEDQFQSQVVFIRAVVQEDERKKTIALVVKFEPPNLDLRKYLNTSVQFFNEVLMYKEILPFLNRHNIVEELFAKFYHGVGTGGMTEDNTNVVVIQDLRPLGYKLAKERGYIDYEHLVTAMSKLGRFHAISYAVKKEFPGEFFALVARLKECSWSDSNSSLNSVVTACIHRAVDPLIKQKKHVNILRSFLDLVKDNDGVNKFMQGLITPEEPIAVVCHGDFCRNNIFFKYDSQEVPIDVKFFDIATARYSSPAVDITFFLLLNCSRDLRRLHWDDLLSIYHQALSTAVPGVKVPSLAAIREEVRLKAIYGFVHCSFFLPMMLFESPPQDLDYVVNSSPEEVSEFHARWGGEEGTKVLTAMVQDLIDLGCLSLENKYILQGLLTK